VVRCLILTSSESRFCAPKTLNVVIGALIAGPVLSSISIAVSASETCLAIRGFLRKTGESDP
jgi:hypothetical protein